MAKDEFCCVGDFPVLIPYRDLVKVVEVAKNIVMLIGPMVSVMMTLLLLLFCIPKLLILLIVFLAFTMVMTSLIVRQMRNLSVSFLLLPVILLLVLF